MIKVKVENEKQLGIVLSSKNVDEVIISRDSFSEKDLKKLVLKIKKANKKASIMLERISRYEEIKNLRTDTDKILDIAELDGIVVQNIDSFAYILRKRRFAKNENLSIELNHTMNCYNSETKKMYMSLAYSSPQSPYWSPCGRQYLSFVAPVELNIHEINEVGYDTLLVYGYIDTMVTANCLRKDTLYNDKNVKMCQNRFDFDRAEVNHSFIKDRKNKDLHYKTYCKFCYNKIYNTDVLYLLDTEYVMSYWSSQSSYWSPCGRQKNIRLDFTIEDEKEVEKILLSLGGKSPYMPKNFTRGHVKNSIV